MRHDQAHPPSPTGATPRELGVVHRLHRAATTTDDQASQLAMMEGLGLLGDLIEARNRARNLTDNSDPPHDDH